MNQLRAICSAGIEDLSKAITSEETPWASKKDFERIIKTAHLLMKVITSIRKRIKVDVKKMSVTDPVVLEEATTILEKGDPIEYIMSVFHADYIGGDYYGRGLLFSALCGTVNNTKGLHPTVDGESGEGKTFAMQTMANLLPEAYVITGMVSPKALYYNNIHPGSTVFLDDVGVMTPELERLIKTTTSYYQRGNDLMSVADGEGIHLTFPKRINWWITGVDAGSFDVQLLNRSVLIGIDEPNKAIKKAHNVDVHEHQRKNGMSGREDFEITREVEVCRAMMGALLSSDPVNVLIPFLNDDDDSHIVVWRDIDNKRNFTLFEDMIRVSASIYRNQRKLIDGSVVAQVEDYDNAMKCWNGICKEQVTKRNKKDQLIIQALNDLKAYENPVDVYALAEKLKKSYSTVYEWLNGVKTKGTKGTLERCSDFVLLISEQTETEYDTVLTVEETGYGGERQREKKTGSLSKRRMLIKLREKLNPLEEYHDVVTIDREKAGKRLERFFASNQ